MMIVIMLSVITMIDSLSVIMLSVMHIVTTIIIIKLCVVLPSVVGLIVVAQKARPNYS